MTALFSHGRIRQASYPQLTHLFQEFLARTNLRLIGGRLRVVQQHMIADGSCAEDMLKVLETRFTQTL